jgi:hypothetical protein
MQVDSGMPLAGFEPALALAISLVASRHRDIAKASLEWPRGWERLPTVAERHGVSGIVAGMLASIPEVSTAVRDEIGGNARRHAVRALHGLQDLTQVVAALDRTGVRAVSLKGPLFSEWLYGSAGVRRIADLDVLIDPRDRDGACAALQQMGYELPAGMSPAIAATVYRSIGAWPLTKPGSLPLDLHWRVAQARFPAPLTPAQILDESVAAAIGGTTVRIPGPTHAAMLALLHGAKHIWGTLEAIAAIDALTRRQDIDWFMIKSMAERARGWTACAAGLRLAGEILGSRNPLEGGLAWPSATDALCVEARRALRLPAGVYPDRWSERRAHRASFDRWPERVLYDLSRLFAPSPLEWQRRALPDALAPLYVPLRVMRIARGALRGRLDAPGADTAARPTGVRIEAQAGSATASGRHGSHAQGTN